jgi:hypothetical protein
MRALAHFASHQMGKAQFGLGTGALLVLASCGSSDAVSFPEDAGDASVAGDATGDSPSTNESESDVTTLSDAGDAGDADAGDGDGGDGGPGDAGDGAPPLTQVEFVSGADWPWFPGDLSGPDGGSAGMAALVCVTPDTPPNCPPGAVSYKSGTAFTWTADTSAFPTARWIWRGDVTPDASADLQIAIFQKSFVLGANPAGTIQIAADDFAEVQVNGSDAGTTGSTSDIGISDQAQKHLTAFDLGAFLVEGSNTITVIGQNGPTSFNSCTGPCTYAQNQAGVVFGGMLTYR